MNTKEKLSQISLDVKKQYETFPYPSYPLLAKPRWQDGYLGTSLFCARLAEGLGFRGHPLLTAENQSIVILGGGEIQPYVLRKFEPKDHKMTTIDLSAQSLRRARIRLLSCFKPMNFVQGDIHQFLEASVPASVAHMEAYGVLHHLEDPASTLPFLARTLAPRGTARFMVYNSSARNWIFHLQKIFKLLDLSPYKKSDLVLARKVLFELESQLPSLKEKLRWLGNDTLRNDARFVDTFFHAREIRIPIERWFALFKEAGLKPFALYDRYGEMDDLRNPLWDMPEVDHLAVRARNFNFENNIEIFLVKEDDKNQHKEILKNHTIFWKMCAKDPPSSWFKFQETQDIPWLFKKFIWHNYLSFIFTSTYSPLNDLLLKIIPLEAWQRLARLGAILPGMIKYEGIKEELFKPLGRIIEGEVQEKEKEPCLTNSQDLYLKKEFQKILDKKEINTPRRLLSLSNRVKLL